MVLLLVLAVRILATLATDIAGSRRFGSRRKHVRKYINLLFRDGPLNFRAMCLAIVVAQFFIMPSEMCFFGRVIHMLVKCDAAESQSEAE